MTIADLSSIRFAVWQDMKTELLGTANADFVYPDLTGYNGPGPDLGYIANGTWYQARAANFNPTLPSQGTIICRLRMLYGSSSKVLFAFNGAGFAISLGWAGANFVLNNTFISGFNDVADTWRVIAATWGPAGVKTYDQGAPFGSNAMTSAPNAVLYGASIGAGFYGVPDGNVYNNIAFLKMDFAAILSRQLSDAEVLDLSTNYTALWAAASGGVNKRQAKLGAKRTGLACGGL